MILEIDVGNTRIKWRLRNDRQVQQSHSALSSLLSDETNYSEIFNNIDFQEVAHVHIASVATAYHQTFTTWLAQHLRCVPIFAAVDIRAAGVVNGYTDVAQMGVDRWLALLAAWKKVHAACLVIDAGSAVTVDILLGNGVHHGGYIVPGLQMMSAALFRNTDRVKVKRDDYPFAIEAGKGTEQAVLAGLPLMIVGLIDRVLEQMKVLGEVMPDIIVTGGDGEYLAQLLSKEGYERVIYVPELVLDGLCLHVNDKNK